MADTIKEIRELIQKDESGTLITLLLSPLAENVMISDDTDAKNIKEYADDLITGLVNGAPEALDTLKELADALADDDDAIAAITTSLATKVDKADGMGLSSNDFTDAEKTKLAGIATGANNYTLPTATASVLGGIKIGTNLSISNGVVSSKDTTYSAATTSAAGLMSASDKTKLDGIATGATAGTNVIVAASMPSDAPNGTICFVTV